MLGYWDNPEDTKAIIDETRWLHSGDIAVMDENGYVSIVGRIKDLIIRGGENISPKEIEDFLIVHEGVSDVQVIGVYSEKYGEEVMAWSNPVRATTYRQNRFIRIVKAESQPSKSPDTGNLSMLSR